MPIDINERIDATRRNSRRRLNLDEITAVLGRTDTNAVANTRMPGCVWVSIYANGGMLSFRSARAPTKYFSLEPNTPVKLKYDVRGRLQVDEPDADAQLTTGVDPVGQATQQASNSTPQSNFETLRVIQSDTADLTVWVKAWKIYGSGLLSVFPGINVDMTSYVPSSGNMLYAMIALKSDYATIEVKTSTARSIGDIDLNVDDENECIALLTTGSTPIWTIKLIGGQTTITQSDIDLDGQDERQLVNNTPSTGGGTVTNVSWVTNDGVSAVIANPTTTPAITPSLGAITPNSTKVKGTGGAGFFEGVAQSSSPSAPAATGLRLFATSVGHLAWRIKNGSDTFIRSFIGVLTADRAYTWPDYDGTVATTAGVETFTNKSISGSQINSGSVAIANGGTGNTTNTAAFDALAPATPTKGDLLVWNGTHWVKQAAGANGLVLSADSTQTTGLNYVAQSAGGGGSNINKTTAQFYERTVLYDNTLSGAGSWDVSSIDQTYDHLELIFEGQATVNAGGSVNANIAFNNDTTDANYLRAQLFVNNAGTLSGNWGTGTRETFNFPDSSGTSGRWGVGYALIENYTSAHNKTILINTMSPRTNTSGFLIDRSLTWSNTSAINRIALVVANATATFATGSRLQIIGIKLQTVVVDVSGTGTVQLTASADTTIASTAAETSLLSTVNGTQTFAVNALSTVGRQLRIDAWGYISDTGTPTITVKFKLGSTVVLTSGAITLGSGISNKLWHFQGVMTVQTAGASGKAKAQGQFTCNGVVTDIVNTTQASLDFTATQLADLTGQFSASSASNTMTCTNVSIEVLN